MLNYFQFEWAVLVVAWRSTLRLLEFKRHKALVSLVGISCGLLATFFILGEEMLNEHVIVAVSTLAGIGGLFLVVLISQIFYAPYRIVTGGKAINDQLKEQNAALRNELEKLKKPQFRGEIMTLRIGEISSNGNLCFTVVLRVTNCGQIPSTLDDWQGSLTLKNGKIVKLQSVHIPNLALWDEDGGFSGGAQNYEISADQYIYERIGNDPLLPGYKKSGCLWMEANHKGRPENQYFEGTKLVIDAIDGHGQKHEFCVEIDPKKFGGNPIHVPGLR